MQRLMDLLLEKSWQEGLGDGCSCSRGELANICCIDCFEHRLVCAQCFLDTHRQNPLHRADWWNSRYFECKSYAELGGVIHLGHRGGECPSRSPDGLPYEITVVHTNGIHVCNIHYCSCSAQDTSWEQLVRQDLFPSSLLRPKTVFTFHLLKFAHQLALCSKSAMYDFATVLRRTTNGAFPDDIQVSFNTEYLNSSVTLTRCRQSMTDSYEP